MALARASVRVITCFDKSPDTKINFRRILTSSAIIPKIKLLLAISWILLNWSINSLIKRLIKLIYSLNIKLMIRLKIRKCLIFRTSLK